MRVAGFRKRAVVVPAVALFAMAGACGDRKLDDESASQGTAASGAAPAGNGTSAPAGDAAPQQNAAPPPRDPLAEAEDSIAEAQLFHKRQQSMESYSSCMEKAKGLEAPQRTVIETACKRSRGAAR